MTRTRFVPLALTAAVLGALTGPGAAQAAGDDLTCGASAARVLQLTEPVRIAGPCTTQDRALATFRTGLLSAVQVEATALRASTVRSGAQPGAATATAQADTVRIALPGLVVEASHLRATADASCVDGRPALATGGALGSLTINGRAQEVGAEPVELALGVATLRLNHTESRPGGVTRRALQLTSALGDVTIGEARAGVTGEPCRTEPEPEPAPDSAVVKAVDAADGSPVAERDAAPGDQVTYRITYRNDGDATARGVVVTDALDRQAPGACEPACTQDGGTVRWALGDVPAGERRELSLQATLPATSAEAGTATFVNRAVAVDHTGSAHSGDVRVRVPYQPRLVVEHLHGIFGEGGIELTADPLVLEEVHYGGWGFGSSFTVRNEGTAPATDLELTSPLADAFSEPDCFVRDGDSCTVEPDEGARRVMDPAGTGSRARWRKARLGIGEVAEAGIGGRLHGGDYAQPESDLSLEPVLHTAQGDVAVVARQVTVRSPIGVWATGWGMHDKDGDGQFEDGEWLQQDEALPVGRLVSLFVGASVDGGRAAHDVVADVTFPAALELLGDPCGEAPEGVTCTYDAATRRMRLTAARMTSRHGYVAARVLARTRLPKGQHQVSVGADFAEGEPSASTIRFRIV